MSITENERSATADALREELLRSRLAGRRGAGRGNARGTGIGRADRSGPLPLSYGQQQMWFLNRLEPESAEYLVPLVLRMRGELDATALERAWVELIVRHEILRTRYTLRGSEPQQVVDAPSAPALPVVDLTGVSAEERLAHARELVEQEAAKPFDLAAEWPVRATLLRLAEDDHVLAVVFHHIACDAWSTRIFGGELSALYAALAKGLPSPLAPLAVQYADYAAWERAQLSGAALERQLSYWRGQLSGALPTDLPADRPRPAVRVPDGAEMPFSFPAGLSDRVRELAGQHGTTPFAVLLTAFQVLVARYTGQSDVSVGTVVSGRTRPELQQLIGYGINTLVMRGQWAGDPRFTDLLTVTRSTVLDAFDHQGVPFALLVDELQPERDMSRTPLHQVAFTMHEWRGDAVDLAGVRIEPFEWRDAIAKYDLTLQVEEGPDGSFGGRLQYATSLFDRATVERTARHLIRLLSAAAADPTLPLSRLEILDDAETALLTGGTGQAGHSVERCTHELFEARAAETPDAVAVVAGGLSLTYAEVNERANRIAHLLRDLGAGPESLVGVCLERGADLIPTLLGVLKSGAGYLPLDPANPSDRLGYVLADAGAKIAITTSTTTGVLEDVFEGHQLVLDRDTEQLTAQPTGNPEPQAGPDNTIYVIYTSGSTGKPKGVVLTHANVVRLMDTANRHYAFSPTDVWSMFHSYAFDVSVFEMWGALMFGGTVVVIPQDIARSPEDFLDLLVEQKVTVLSQTPTAFRSLIALAANHDPRIDQLALRAVVFAGEKLETTELRPWVDRRGLDAPALINMYGITETTVHTTYHRLTEEDLEPLASNRVGDPLEDLSVVLLDQQGNLVPIGVPGEIHVGGPGLARGYLRRPELTAERFIPNPYGPTGSRLYRSGDLARRRPDGTLEFLGRIDHQVKIRGYRIELGEITQALLTHPGIRQAVVVVREDTPGDKRLVGYLVPVDGEAPEGRELRGLLSQTLPDYMVPAAYVTLDAIPLTVNGKLDQRALPAPDTETQGDTYVAPRTPAEEQLAAIWAQVLERDRVGIEDTFFDLGGDSIRAVVLVGALRNAGFDTTVRDVFEHRTVARLCEHITGRPATAAPATTVQPFALISPEDRAALPTDITDAYPLSQVQLGMVVEMEAGEGGNSYHNCSIFRIKDEKPFSLAAFQQAGQVVTARHEALRTSIDLTGYSRPLQLVHASAEMALGMHDLRGLGDQEVDRALRAFSAQERADLFDTAVPPLIRFDAHLVDGGWWLSVTEHHVILEGWSHHSLVMELLRTYHSLRDGLEPEPYDNPPVRFADFIATELKALESEDDRAYWQGVMTGNARFTLPSGWGDSPQTPRRMLQTAAPWHDLETRLRALAGKAKASLKSVMVAAHLKVLSQLTDEASFHSGLVCDARPEALGADRVLGMYLNTLPFVADRTARTWRELVERTFAREVELWPHRQYPMPAIQREWGGSRRLMDVFFNYQDFRQVDAELVAHGVGYDDSPTEFPLTVSSRGGYVILTTDSHAINQANSDRLAGMYRAVLEAMAADAEGDATAVRLPADEHRQLAEEWSTPRTTGSVERCTHELFEARAAETPDAVAVVAGGLTLTYAEVNERANRIAHLLRDLGAGPESLVGVCLERGADLIPTLLGVLKSGAGYLPLDPANPSDRLGYVLADAGAKIAITTSTTTGVLEDVFEGHQLVLDRDTEQLAAQPTGNPEPQAGPDNTIYVIYTSGSTGKPKGVVLTHANVVRLMDTANRHYAFSPTDVWSMFHSYAFDVSVFEMWGALMFGGTVVVIPQDVARSPEDFLDLLVEQKVTVLSQTPTAFRSLIALAANHDPRIDQLALRAVVFAGEKLETTELRPWVDRRGLDAPALINMYGITETTVHTTYHRLTEEDLEPLASNRVGDPLEDLSVVLLDQQGNLVPIGVPGEIHVGGPGLARGYLRRPELTAERFIPNPYGPTGSRLYRSGDLARRRPDGTLEFLGRIDHQVKIRGYRIELGEITQALLTHPGIRQAVVVVREDTPGDKRLVGYLVPSGEEVPQTRELRALLGQSLPDYMVPAAFVALDAIPLTVNGKLDQRALPAPDTETQGDTYIAPRTPAEEQLAAIWAQVLERDRVGIEDTFFDLGGDSIRAVALVGALRSAGFDTTVRDVFEHRTVARLCEHITGRPATAAPATTIQPFALISPEDRAALPTDITDAYPVSQAQLGMLVEMLSGTGEEGTNYQQCVSHRVRDERPFSEPALRAALAVVTDRHEVLRTSFDLTGYAQPLQLVHADVDVPLRVEDLRALGEQEQQGALRAFFAAERAAGFDPAATPLFRVTVHLESDRSWRLAFSQPHAITQGWGQFALLTELVECYRRLRDGLEPAPYDMPPVRFADFIAGELESLASAEERAYWHDVVGRHAPLSLPAGWGEPGDGPGKTLVFQVPLADLEQGLRAFASEARVSLKSVLLAGHLKVLSRLTDEAAFHTGLVCDARPEVEGADRVLGMYLNTLPFPADRTARTWRELVERTFAREVELWPHRRYPMQTIQRETGGGRRQIDVIFNYHDFRSFDSADIDAASSIGESSTEFALSVATGGAGLNLTADSRVIGRSGGERLAGMYRSVFEAMLADPDGDARAACLAAEDERLLAAWTATGRTEDWLSIEAEFERHAATTPASPALTADGTVLGYAEVNERANRLAHHLRALGVGRDTLVGICADRSPDTVVAVLAVLKAGGAYLPLDPAYPADRLAYMVEDARVAVVLTTGRLAALAPAPVTVLLDEPGQWADRPADNPEPSARPGDLAYVIYTSGSTGRPKGVQVHRRGMANHLIAKIEDLGITAADAVAQNASMSFDISVWQMLSALAVGGRTHVVDAASAVDPLALVPRAEQQRVTVLEVVPSLLRAALDAWDSGALTAALPELRYLVVTGETLPPDLCRRWLDRFPGVPLVNAYGPTECSDDITHAVIGPDSTIGEARVTIGRPVRNTRLYVLDASLTPAPVGVPGELYAGGVGVARGYGGRPELTAERFVPDPFGPAGSRLYRTGDVAAWNEDGSLEFLGRVDHQVKIRGVRIELGEIEAALTELPQVAQAAVAVREDVPGRPRLVGYLVPAEELPQPEELHTLLARSLPESMIPTVFVPLEALPLTANGKVDRNALPEPGESAERGTEYVAPATATERRLAGIWSEVLGGQQVGTLDNFFRLGGDSILVIKVVAGARQAGLPLSLFQLYQYGTLGELAAALDGQAAEERVTGPAAAPAGPQGHTVLQPVLDALAECGVPGASLAVVEGGELVELHALGTLAEGGSEPVTPETLFQVGSWAKHATAFGVLRLVDRGLIDLDEDVNRYLRSWQLPGEVTQRPVTVRHLLSHLAGLTETPRRGVRPGEPVPDLLDLLRHGAPGDGLPTRRELAPGEVFRKSNAHFSVLEQLLADVVGAPFPVLMAELVFEPVGMAATGFDQTLPQRAGRPVALGHDQDGRVLPGGWVVQTELAAAGLWTTAADMARLELEIRRSYLGRPLALLSQRSAEQMLTPHSTGFYGLGTIVDAGGLEVEFGHGGSPGGYQAVSMSQVHRGSGLVVLTNAESSAQVLTAASASLRG
ncbi:amino acid adenylation domain-containing protein [Kitasatospora sp. HPMI-4]|uniref:non-ribosomal peptide synthetase n=1 Tax=Kitasatospora sp. HPMI-4 TaxID=3448443 RepID=UPI003F1B97C7